MSCGLDFVSIIDGTESVQPLCRFIGRLEKVHVPRIAEALQWCVDVFFLPFNRSAEIQKKKLTEMNIRLVMFVLSTFIKWHAKSGCDMSTFLDTRFFVKSIACLFCYSSVRIYRLSVRKLIDFRINWFCPYNFPLHFFLDSKMQRTRQKAEKHPRIRSFIMPFDLFSQSSSGKCCFYRLVIEMESTFSPSIAYVVDLMRFSIDCGSAEE